jgi:RNA polymerase sigma-70 factor (ECF subfamily)
MTMKHADRGRWTTRSSLLRRLRSVEDHAAWAEFDRIYRQLIRAVAMRRGLSASEADDVVQETMLTLVRVMPRFEYDPDRCHFRGWLQQQAERRITDYLRRRPAHEAAARNPDDTRRTATIERLPDPASLEADAVWDTEWRQHVLEQALDKLRRSARPLHYQVFFLQAIKGQSPARVARTLGVNLAQVYLLKHRVARVFKRLVEIARRELDREATGQG